MSAVLELLLMQNKAQFDRSPTKGSSFCNYQLVYIHRGEAKLPTNNKIYPKRTIISSNFTNNLAANPKAR